MNTVYEVTTIGVNQVHEENYRKALSRFLDIVSNTGYTCVLARLKYNEDDTIESTDLRIGGTEKDGTKWECDLS